jgi:hypothetical protein
VALAAAAAGIVAGIAVGIVAGIMVGIAAGIAAAAEKSAGIAAEAVGIAVTAGKAAARILFCPRRRPRICGSSVDDLMTELSVYISVLSRNPQKLCWETPDNANACEAQGQYIAGDNVVEWGRALMKGHSYSI